jgi:hypothetical protein
MDENETNTKPDPDTIKFMLIMSVTVVRSSDGEFMFVESADLDGTSLDGISPEINTIIMARAERLAKEVLGK